MTRMLAVVAAALVAAVLGATAWLAFAPRGDDRFAQCRATQVSGGAGAIGGPFTLVDGSGATVTDADVITEPTLIYFGYTFCPDVCPFDAARNAAAVDVLADRGISATPVFISVDPERDTPEVVGDYAASIHPRMIGLTGSPEQVRAASQAYRTYYRRKEGSDDFYLVDHSVFTYLVLPGEGFVEFYGRDVPPDAMADSVACFVRAAG
jgi:protein SCO1